MEGYPQQGEEGLPQSPPQPCWEITRSKAIFHIPFPSPAKNKVLSAGGGAVELAEGSQRNRRRYFPSASASSGGGSHCHPRISSCTEAHPAAVRMRFSPARIASSLGGSLFPARKTSALNSHLAPETALSRARRALDRHLAPETALYRAGRAFHQRRMKRRPAERSPGPRPQ